MNVKQKIKKEKIHETVGFQPTFKKLVHSEAVVISVKYAFFGILWILLSDQLLEYLFRNIEVYRELQTIKGWFYILITTMMLYFMIQKSMKLRKLELQKTSEAYVKLQTAHEELVTVETELKYQKDLTENLILEAPMIIMTWDDKGRILSINPLGQKLFGYSEEELQNSVGLDVLIPKQRTEITESIYNEIQRKKQFMNYDGPIQTKDGKIIDILWSSKQLSMKPGANGYTYVSIGTDIEERKRYEEKVQYMAYYDALTGLPNRAMFEIEINLRLNEDLKSGQMIIAYIDIDNFKNINDSMGHQVGDNFLKYMADCLISEIKEPNFVARLGGDEFAILFSESSREEVDQNIEVLRNHISKTWSIQNRQFYISMSVGIVVCPDHGDTSTTLLKNADIAMYAAKREGKNRTLYYKDDIQETNSWHVKMINNLQYAIDGQQFTLFYQPQFNLENGEIIGMEALVRWNHPEDGFISPVEFIPLAEETGQIYRLERWIVTKALEQKKILESKGFHNLILSINLSSKTLTSEVNFEELEQIFDEFQVDYAKVVIEITETANISDVDIVINHLERLKKRGLSVALDDFGTGYSSLNYLKKFPIDIIKLDKSFIGAITENGMDTMLIKNILLLAHDLDFEVVAEGIETKEQLQYLKAHSCESGQGFLLSKPLPEEKVLDLLNNSYRFITE